MVQKKLKKPELKYLFYKLATMEEKRYTYKIFGMDSANDVIYNSLKPIDWTKVLAGNNVVQLWSDRFKSASISRVSEINADNKEFRKTLWDQEKEQVKAIMYKVSSEQPQDFLSYKQQNVWNLPSKSN